MKYLLFTFLLFPTLLSAQKHGQEVIDSLVGQLPKCTEDTNKVKLLNKISFAYDGYDAKAGIKYGEAALALAEKLAWQNGIAEAYNITGANYMVEGNAEQALACFLKSLKINEQLGYKKGIARNLGNIGNTYYAQGDFPKSLDYLFKALKKFEEIADSQGIATQLGNIGNIYDENKNFRKAIEYDSLAMLMYQRLKDKEGAALMAGNIGNVYDDLGSSDKALEYDLESLAIFRTSGNKEGIARNLCNISVIYSSRKNFYKALTYQLEALKLFQQQDNQNGIGLSNTNIGDYYYRIAEDSSGIRTANGMTAGRQAYLKLAKDYVQNAIFILKQTNNLNGLSYNYKLLADIQVATKDYKGAIESFLNYTVYKDSVFSIESSKKINNLENQRQLDIKESRIKILAQENKVKDLNAVKDKLTRRLLMAGIAMVIIIALSLVMYYVRRERNEKLLANEKINTLLKEQELQSVSNMLEVQEQERKRIAADLHDRLGSMLSTVKLYFNSVEEQIDKLKEQNREQYHKATSLLDDACDEVRKIAHNLVSGELVKFGLVSALNQLKDTIANSGKLQMNVFAFGMEERLDSATEISLYRVVQELMNNILKHAKATEVTIQLNKVENNLNIVVEDNGVGFDIDTAMAKDGMGLKNLETRVKKLNGIISVDSGKGRGTTTIIDIPV